MRTGKIVLPALCLVLLATACAGPRAAGTAAPARKYAAVVVHPFSLQGAAIQENAQVQAFSRDLPATFARNVKSYLEARRNPPAVTISGKAGAESVIVEGAFVDITAGSTAARWIVGMGAGRSTVSARWTFKDGASGQVLGNFEEAAHTGGTYTGITALESDADALARKVVNTLARFLR